MRTAGPPTHQRGLRRHLGTPFRIVSWEDGSLEAHGISLQPRPPLKTEVPRPLENLVLVQGCREEALAGPPQGPRASEWPVCRSPRPSQSRLISVPGARLAFPLFALMSHSCFFFSFPNPSATPTPTPSPPSANS